MPGCGTYPPAPSARTTDMAGARPPRVPCPTPREFGRGNKLPAYRSVFHDSFGLILSLTRGPGK